MREEEVVVVGAGQAGLAAALALKDAGVRPLVLDRSEGVGSAWRGRYDRLRLNTCRPLSHLPGRKYPKGTPMFPSREQVVAHLEEHANDGLEIQFGTDVTRLERDDGGRWLLRTSIGDVRAGQVIFCSGREREPVVPKWPGRDDFAGTLIHSADYRNAEQFSGRRVLVVGAGCSGMEIAYDVADGGAAKVWLAVRTPPNIMLRTGPGGLPGDMIATVMLHVPVRAADAFERFGRKMDFGDLAQYGLPIPEEGSMARFRREGKVPAIVDKPVIEAIKAGRIEVVGAVENLDASGVLLADGRRLELDAVICATGYRSALEPIVGHLGVLDERGYPRVIGDPVAPGLRFHGFDPRPGALGYMGKEAKRAARAIAKGRRREAVAA